MNYLASWELVKGLLKASPGDVAGTDFDLPAMSVLQMVGEDACFAESEK